VIWQILLALAIGVIIGVSGLAPDALSANLDTLLTAVLCLLLFVIGIDLSQNSNLVAEIKRMGLRLLLVPLLIAAGSIAGALVISLLIGLTPQYGMAIGAGFGWYSLSSVLLAPIHLGEIGIMAAGQRIAGDAVDRHAPFVVRYLGKTAAVAGVPPWTRRCRSSLSTRAAKWAYCRW
jgi:uncharacterized membrane protein YbjE (DUF340 family)